MKDKLLEIRIGRKHIYGLFEDGGIKHQEEIGLMTHDVGIHTFKIKEEVK